MVEIENKSEQIGLRIFFWGVVLDRGHVTWDQYRQIWDFLKKMKTA